MPRKYATDICSGDTAPDPGPAKNGGSARIFGFFASLPPGAGKGTPAPPGADATAWQAARQAAAEAEVDARRAEPEAQREAEEQRLRIDEEFGGDGQGRGGRSEGRPPQMDAGLAKCCPDSSNLRSGTYRNFSRKATVFGELCSNRGVLVISEGAYLLLQSLTDGA